MLPLGASRLRQFPHLIPIGIGIAIVVVAYLQALNFPFFSDDEDYIPLNSKLASLPLSELWRLFTEPYNVFEFLPLRDLSYWIDITLFGFIPAAFRIHNLILYLLSLPLVYATTMSLWRYFRPDAATSAPWFAAIVTALFTLHPAHVEMVVWITGRKDVLAGLFSWLALWLAVTARREHGLSAPHAIGTLIAFAAVMFSKASYIAVAPVIAILWCLFWFNLSAKDRQTTKLLWPLSILLLAVLMLITFIDNSTVKNPSDLGIAMVTQSLAAMGRLASITLSPGSRHFYYPVTEYPYFSGMIALGGLVLATASAGVLLMLRKRSLEGFALVAFVLLCVPYIHLIPFRTFALVQDRYVALALWPIVLLAVILSWRLNTLPRTLVLLLVSLPWIIQTIDRPREWRNYEEILNADIREYHGYYVPVIYKIIFVHLPQGLNGEALTAASDILDPDMRKIATNLVQADAVRGRAINTGDPSNAISALSKMEYLLNQQPDKYSLNSPRAYVLNACRQLLVIEWKSLAKQFANDALVRYHAGLWMTKMGDYVGAISNLRAATESRRLPEGRRGTAYKNIGFAMMRRGDIAEAESYLRLSLLQTLPDMEAQCFLAEIYRKTERKEEEKRAELACNKYKTSTEGPP